MKSMAKMKSGLMSLESFYGVCVKKCGDFWVLNAISHEHGEQVLSFHEHLDEPMLLLGLFEKSESSQCGLVVDLTRNSMDPTEDQLIEAGMLEMTEPAERSEPKEKRRVILRLSRGHASDKELIAARGLRIVDTQTASDGTVGLVCEG